MHGQGLNYSILLDEPSQASYFVYGRTYTKAPSLPMDQVSEIACQEEWVEYNKGHPLYHMVAYYDRVLLQTVKLVVEGEEVVDQRNQWILPCQWKEGQCHAEGRTYVWNTTDIDYCKVALLKVFLGQRLHANISDLDAPLDQEPAEAIVSSEGGEKIRIFPSGPTSQCGRVVTASNIEDMFLLPIMETDDLGNIVLDNRDRVFTREIHPSEVDLRKCIANCDEYLNYDITTQVEREFNTILHQDCLIHQDEAPKAHFLEQGFPGYRPFLLQDGIFLTQSGETNYRYECLARRVHPVLLLVL